MKKTILLVMITLIVIKLTAQEIAYRNEGDESLLIATTNELLQKQPQFCQVNAIALITKDTVSANHFGLTFVYKTPKQIFVDTNSIVEIYFSDGDKYEYHYAGIEDNLTKKDSVVNFSVLVAIRCMYKLTEVPVQEIRIITPIYKHSIFVEDKMKLVLPNLVNYLFKKTEEEIDAIYEIERAKNVPAIEFDATANNKLDRKYFGTYSGEWNCEDLLYNFELTIGYDTSYIVWHIVKDTAEENPNRIKTQLLNIRKENTSNLLVLDVCYDPTKENYTNGRRTFYLKLSENGQVIYGSTHAFDRWGEMYGLRKSR